jgi:hypothetical protein
MEAVTFSTFFFITLGFLFGFSSQYNSSFSLSISFAHMETYSRSDQSASIESMDLIYPLMSTIFRYLSSSASFAFWISNAFNSSSVNFNSSSFSSMI